MERQPQNPGLSLGSQPQNPESRNNPENFHPCINNYTLYAEKISSVNTVITRILLILIWIQILPHDIHLKQDNSLSNWPAHLIIRSYLTVFWLLPEVSTRDPIINQRTLLARGLIMVKVLY